MGRSGNSRARVHRQREGLAIKKLPSEYFHNQIYTTFFNDAVGGHILSWWSTDNCMWSNDFLHGNSTWPNSRGRRRDLGDLPPPLRAKLMRENVAQLYNIPVPSADSVIGDNYRNVSDECRLSRSPPAPHTPTRTMLGVQRKEKELRPYQEDKDILTLLKMRAE